MRIRKTLYGWCRAPGEFCLGRLPPDAPNGPYEIFETMADVELAAKGRKARLVWCGAPAIDKQIADAATLRVMD